jgi:hypothetical protein
MREKKGRGKDLEVAKGVRPSTRVLDDGTEEVVPGSYRIETAAGQVRFLIGVNLSTAREYKRILDDGFTETEMERVRNNEPFSDDPEVDCNGITSFLECAEYMFIADLPEYLEDLKQAIVSPDKRDPMTAHLSVEDLFGIVRKGADRMRIPWNLDLARRLNELEITGDVDRDRAAIEKELDYLAHRKAR